MSGTTEDRMEAALSRAEVDIKPAVLGWLQGERGHETPPIVALIAFVALAVEMHAKIAAQASTDANVGQKMRDAFISYIIAQWQYDFAEGCQKMRLSTKGDNTPPQPLPTGGRGLSATTGNERIIAELMADDPALTRDEAEALIREAGHG